MMDTKTEKELKKALNHQNIKFTIADGKAVMTCPKCKADAYWTIGESIPVEGAGYMCLCGSCGYQGDVPLYVEPKPKVEMIPASMVMDLGKTRAKKAIDKPITPAPAEETETKFNEFVDIDDMPRPAFNPLWQPPAKSIIDNAFAKHLSCDIDSIALGTLAIYSYCVSRDNYIESKPGYIEQLNLFVASIEESGSKKSAKHRLCTAPLINLQQQINAQEQYNIEQRSNQRRQILKRIAVLENHAAKGDHEGDKELSDLLEQISELPELHYTSYLTSESTPEATAKLLQQNNEKLLYTDSEGGFFSLINGRYTNGVVNADLYLKSFSGDYTKVNRVNSEPLILHRPCTSIYITLQPSIFENTRNIHQLYDNGLLARFCFVCPDAADFDEFETPSIPQYIFQDYEALIKKLLDVKGRRLTLAPAAKDIYADFYKSYYQRMTAELEGIKFWAAKARGLCLRIAAVMQLIKDTESQVVDADTIENAIGITNYLTEHAQFAFNQMRLPEDMSIARRIVRWMLRNKLKSFTAGDLRVLRTTKTPTIEALEPGIQKLIDNGYIRRKVGVSSNGRPPIIFIINPILSGHKGGDSYEHTV